MKSRNSFRISDYSEKSSYKFLKIPGEELIKDRQEIPLK